MYIKENLLIKLSKPKYSIFLSLFFFLISFLLKKFIFLSTQNQEKMDENTYNNINQEEFEETLSFCDLSFESQELDRSLSFHRSPNSPSHELFQFPFIPNTPLNNQNAIIFCGKLIKAETFDDDQSRYLFPLSSARQLNNNKNDLGSLYLVNSKPKSSLPTKSFRSQSFSSSRKHKVLIGLAKIPPKMELSDIKKRQSRRNPSPMFPPVVTGDLEAMVAGDGCGAGGRRRGHQWSLLRSFRGGAHLASILAKASLGCIPRV